MFYIVVFYVVAYAVAPHFEYNAFLEFAKVLYFHFTARTDYQLSELEDRHRWRFLDLVDNK